MNFDSEKTPNLVIDHIDGQHANNRKSNLRLVSNSLNRLNAISTRNNSGFIGVRKPNTCLFWTAQFSYKGIVYRQGSFETSD
jgi:hypothetical protein